MYDRKYNFEEQKNFPLKSVGSTFSYFSKGKKNFKILKAPETKRCAIRRLNVPNFCYFSEKLR